WLLVLLKLLTPPLWTVPIGWFRSPSVPTAAAPHFDPPVIAAAPDDAGAEDIQAEQENPGLPLAQPEPSPVLARPGPADASTSIASYVALVWFIGSVFCLVAAASRVIRFRRLLRYANYAGQDVQSRAARLA